MLSNIYIIVYDVRQFFKKNIINIIQLSILSALISLIIQNIFKINTQELSILYGNHFFKNISLIEIINKMNIAQRKILFYIEGIKTISIILNDSFFYTSMIYLIQSISYAELQPLYAIIIKSLKSFFWLIPFTGLQLFLIETRFTFFIIPRILFFILFSLSPIIFLSEKKNIFYAVKDSIKISWNYIYTITPVILFWLFLKQLIIILTEIFFVFSIYINVFMLHIFVNIGFSLIIIYLFRLHFFFKIKNIID